MKLNAIIEKTHDGCFVGQVEEVPAAISQGRDINGLYENLHNAVHLLIETDKIIDLTLKPV
ncbi:MAG: type II toxin-antitoxin system HicB family antitoxin [Cyclobacteriaceae bacterium]